MLSREHLAEPGVDFTLPGHSQAVLLRSDDLREVLSAVSSATDFEDKCAPRAVSPSFVFLFVHQYLDCLSYVKGNMNVMCCIL